MGSNRESIEDIKTKFLLQMHDEFQKMKVCMDESFSSLEATMNHMVEIVRKMSAGDGILSIYRSKTSAPKRRRARSTRVSHQHQTFWKQRQKHKRKRKKISQKKKIDVNCFLSLWDPSNFLPNLCFL
ncbi:hypothetical protein Bca101_019798 [Brassica carinata]